MAESLRRPQQTVFFPWTKEMETGVRVIDLDHRSLVDVINQLHAEWLNGRFPEALPGLTGALLDYCSEHFLREEKIMEKHGYPGLRLHKERHRGIRRFVYALRVVAREAPYRIDPEKMLMFLRDWLVNHIGKSDMDYVGHIQAQMAADGSSSDLHIFDEALPAEVLQLELCLPPGDQLLVQQVAEILRGSRRDAMELEKTVQEILNRRLFDIPLADCETMVHDLLR